MINSESRMNMHFAGPFESIAEVETSLPAVIFADLGESYPGAGFLGMELLITDNKKYAGIIMHFDSVENVAAFKAWTEEYRPDQLEKVRPLVERTRGTIDGYSDFALFLNLLD